LISVPPIPSDLAVSEHLARRWFSVVQRGAFDELASLLHPDVHLVSKVRAGVVIEGRDAALAFINETLASSLYEAVGEVYTALDDYRVVVEGRMRWIDEDRVIRDDPVVWAMEFREELLHTFVPVRTVIEAEAVLASVH
jgi:SnoaL-like protein